MRSIVMRSTAVRSTVDALQGFPAVADAYLGRQAPLVRLAREDDALKLCVGKPAPGEDIGRQFRAVDRRWMRRRQPWPRTAPAALDGAAPRRS